MNEEISFGIYDDFFEVQRDLNIGTLMLETVLLNGKNLEVNKYLKKALPLMRQALSYMSDAEFELFTSPSEMRDG